MKAVHYFSTTPSIYARMFKTALSHFRFVLKSQHGLTMTEIREDYFKLNVIMRSCAEFELKDENDRYRGNWLLVEMGNEFLESLIANNEMIGIPADHALMAQLRQRTDEIINENELASTVKLTRLVTEACDELFADFYRRHERAHELLNEMDSDSTLARLSIEEIVDLNIYELTRRQLQIITSVMLDETFNARMRLRQDEEVTDDEAAKLEFVDNCVAHLFMDKLFTNP